MHLFYILFAVLASAIFNFKFWHRIRKQRPWKPESTKSHWIESLFAFWFTISVSRNQQFCCFERRELSELSELSGLFELFELSKLFELSELFELFELFDCSNLFEQVRTGSNAGISNRTPNSSKCLGSVHIPTNPY